jgi:hypothetical protein
VIEEILIDVEAMLTIWHRCFEPRESMKRREVEA